MRIPYLRSTTVQILGKILKAIILTYATVLLMLLGLLITLNILFVVLR